MSPIFIISRWSRSPVHHFLWFGEIVKNLSDSKLLGVRLYSEKSEVLREFGWNSSFLPRKRPRVTTPPASSRWVSESLLSIQAPGSPQPGLFLKLLMFKLFPLIPIMCDTLHALASPPHRDRWRVKHIGNISVFRVRRGEPFMIRISLNDICENIFEFPLLRFKESECLTSIQ